MTNVDESLSGAWPVQPPEIPPTAGYPAQAAGPPAGWADQAPPLPPAAPPTGSGSGSGGKGVVIVVAVVVVLALLGGAFVAGTKLTSSTDTAAPPSSSSSSSTAPQSSTTTPSGGGSPSTTTPKTGGSTGGAIDARAAKAEVDKLKGYVEQDRGLKFKTDVNVTALNQADFKARVLQEFNSEKDALQKQGQLLQALGLIPADADPVAIQLGLLGDGVLGFYDPASKELVVGGSDITPFWDEIMTHELTHALDDQNLNLNRPELDNATDGRSDAWHALVEGNARRVEYDYVRSLPKDKQKDIVNEELQLGLTQMGGGASDVPIALALVIQSPYDYGEPFVRTLLKDKGQPGLDAAFANPPTSTEQILQPDKYEGNDGPKPVAAPPADGDTVLDGTLGELMTGFALNGPVDQSSIIDGLLGGGADGAGGLGNLDPNEILNGILGGDDPSGSGDPGSGGSAGSIDPNDPLGGLSSMLGGMFDDPTQLNSLGGAVPKADQVKNWGGDHFVLTKAGTDLCVTVDWTMDSPQDLKTFSGQLDAWAAKDSKVTIGHPSDTVVRARRCVTSTSSGGPQSGAPGI